MLFSDESKFNRLGSDGRQYVRRRKDEEFNPRCTVSMLQGGGGSVMVWGVISANGPGPIVHLQGQINSIKYINMLNEHFLPYFGRNLDDNPIFMQDNAPIHTAGRLNCRKRAFFDKITLLLNLGNHFKSVSEATDLDSIVFPVSNSRTTRFGGITNTAFSQSSVPFSHHISICGQFYDWINQKGAD